MAQHTVRLSSVAQADLHRLKSLLQADFGVKATSEDIASALLHGVTGPQLVGMLLAYNQAVASGDDKGNSIST